MGKGLGVLGIFAALGGFGPFSEGKDYLAGIDIEKEYKLIMKKESSLSSRKRDAVVRRYERIMERKESKN